MRQGRRHPIEASVLAAAVLLACGLTACSEQVERADTATEAGLGIGASGPEVQRAHEYLTRFGYFPNAELAQSYPGWRPVVAEAPADPNVFDANTEDALYAFQTIFRLPETGRLDAATLSAMTQPRCGVPDDAPDTGDKWAQVGFRWNKSTLNVSYNATGAPSRPSGTSRPETHINAAAFNWSLYSGYQLNTSTGTSGDIRIGWGNLGTLTLGSANPPSSGIASTVSITMNNASSVRWNFGDIGDATWSSSAADFQGVVLHELGHALGLHHSSIFHPVMSPALPLGATDRDLEVDDVQGIHTLNAGHHRIASPDSSNASRSIVCDKNDTIWATGGQPVGTGFRIYSYQDFGGGSGVWSEHRLGGWATQLAAADDGIWHINNLGEIYREGSGGWERIDGEASFIAASHGEIWHLSKNVTRNTKEHDLYRWNGNGWSWVSGKASDIALTQNRVNDKIELWYTTEAGRVYRQNVGESATLMPAVPNGACGISTGADGAVYALQCPANGSAVAVFMYNSQPLLDTSALIPQATDASNAPKREGWVQVWYTAAKDFTSTSKGTMFHIGSDGIYESD